MSKKRKHLAREAERLRKHAAAGRIVNGIIIPEGAIPANPTQQPTNNSYSPPLYYVDQVFTCVDCGVEQTWTASQQKWYYEVAKGSIYGRAVRCRKCRAAQRRMKSDL
jgi:hypothetical protein